MRKILALLDYNNRFTSKTNSKPYRSGMDKELLVSIFKEYEYNLEFIKISEINFRKNNFNGMTILINSSEDYNLYYKDYIEDILLGLLYQGANLIPNFKYFRAHSNKVFMEIIRDLLKTDEIINISSNYFGTLEELNLSRIENMKCVIKPATGAVSRGVALAKNQEEIMKYIKKISRSRNLLFELWDLGRKFKHNKYILESKHRKKYIVQNFVEGLKNDWKILIYGDKYYVLYRKNRKNDFRASGSGLFEFKKEVPAGILDYAKKVFFSMRVPNLSIDVGFNGKDFFLLEFQALYFGTTTIEKAPFFFKEENSNWSIINKKSILEREYVKSIVDFIENV